MLYSTPEKQTIDVLGSTVFVRCQGDRAGFACRNAFATRTGNKPNLLRRLAPRSFIFAFTLVSAGLPFRAVAQTVPNPPGNLRADVISPTQIKLAWLDNSTNESGFKIERAPDNGGSPGAWAQIATVGSGVATATDTGLTVNATYWYRVRAYNASGDSPSSNLVQVTPSNGQSITVMQWNIEGHIGSLLSNNTATARAIARIVNYNQPDILLFCELQDHGPGANTAALIDWVTNNAPYLGSSFYVSVAGVSDGFERNGAGSRFPIANDLTYSDGLRGLHAFQVQLNGVSALQIYHAHLKCCSDGDSCDRKQSEAESDATNIIRVAATSPLPYIVAGDWNEDENNPQCALSSTYHPITTLRESGGLVEFKPTNLDGEYRTWSTASTTPSIRFDYILAATNRLAPSSGYVFSTRNWASHGLYTNASPQNLVNDSRTGSDHYSVFVKYFLPSPTYTVTPTSLFASTGLPGGPFTPASQTYTLSNTNSSPLSWGVDHPGNWLSLSATNGTLPAGASTNLTATLNSAANALTPAVYADGIRFADTLTRASITLDLKLTVLWPPPVASFTASPTVGPAPLTVTFTDTSTGNITSRSWNFGDGNTAVITTNGIAHTYVAGTYTVTQIETGPGGVTTNIQPSAITALTPYQAWQVRYFGSTNNPAAAPTADADGTGQNNLAKFLGGLDPTNPASIFWITTLAREGNDLRVTWSCVGGHTYALQGTTWVAGSGYTNAFFDISPAIAAAGVGASSTNFLIAGALARPGPVTPVGPVAGAPAQPPPSAQLLVESTAYDTRGLADASGNAVAISNLVMLGAFSIDEPTIQSNFNAGNIRAILSAFTPCGPAFIVGQDTGAPATWDQGMDGTSLIGRQMYLVAVNHPTLEGATQLGIFTGPTWILPGDSSYTNLDLETATDFVVGTAGGPLTIDWGGPYTFTDTAQLAVIPVAHRFYRIRLVQ